MIAQDVEEIFPECVNKECGAVPDVYQTMPVKWVDEHNFTVEWGRPEMSSLPQIGARLRVIAETTSLTAEVIGVQGNTVALRTAQCHMCAGSRDSVFVWGTFVDDLRSVEYDSLACLNISATHALLKMVDDLQAENATLRSNLDGIEARLSRAQL